MNNQKKFKVYPEIRCTPSLVVVCEKPFDVGVILFLNR